MQQHIITTYTIDEHPNPDACIEYVRENWHDLYSWQQENADSLIAFASQFSLSAPYWEVGLWGHSYATASVHEDLAEMSGVRLWKYLHNSGLLTFTSPRSGERAPLLDLPCPFTGYSMDNFLLDPIREFLVQPDSRTFQELIDECLAVWVSEYIKDWEYAYSDDAIREHLEANEYQFTETGEFYA